MTKPKLRTYITYKNTFQVEEYTKYCKSRRKRSLLAQFRMGILPIAIETGRFKNESIENRVCKVCTSNVVEDEKHLLCYCELYRDIRHTMYSNITLRNIDFPNLNGDEKFIYLMNNEWKEVANFLDEAWYLRTNKLYLYK